MPPTSQGEDPNDPNRPLTYDERKKHEESETFGIESLSIRESLPREVREIIAQQLRGLYEKDISDAKAEKTKMLEKQTGLGRKERQSIRAYESQWMERSGRPIEPRDEAERQSEQQMRQRRDTDTINFDNARERTRQFEIQERDTRRLIQEIGIALRTKNEPPFYWNPKN